MAGSKFTVELDFKKETPGTVVYAASVQPGGKPPEIKQQYIEKWALPNKPKQLRITVEEVE